MTRLSNVLALVALSAALVACSGAAAADATGTPAPTSVPASGGVSIVAKDIRFQTTQVSAKPGAAFTIEFDNQDGAPHNIAISDASGAKVFGGEIVTQSKVTYQIPALAAGTYTFICEVHPDMKGTITVQ